MGEEEVGSKIPLIKEIKDEDVFLVLPSFAEPFSQNIKQIICHEKKKLCKINKYNAIFSNTKIRLAFTNNKSITVGSGVSFAIWCFHVPALGGLYCDHGNKLMRGNYSSRTGTFFCIWLHSRNVIHLLWV